VAFRSPFDSTWPRYAVVAHVLFWGISATFIISCILGYAGMMQGQMVITLFWLWILSAFVLGFSAILSAKLYHGNQVFRRAPMQDMSARIIGFVVAAAAALLMFFAYGLFNFRGG
jgi:hypothetical protein